MAHTARTLSNTQPVKFGSTRRLHRCFCLAFRSLDLAALFVVVAAAAVKQPTLLNADVRNVSPSRRQITDIILCHVWPKTSVRLVPKCRLQNTCLHVNFYNKKIFKITTTF